MDAACQIPNDAFTPSFIIPIHSRDRILKSIDKLVEKEKMTMQFADDTMARIEFTTDIGALADTDFIVEAIIENMDLKEDLYTALGDMCKPETIFASNTSSLSIGEMAAFSGRPQNFVGVHFFNPVQVGTLLMTDVFTKCYEERIRLHFSSLLSLYLIHIVTS